MKHLFFITIVIFLASSLYGQVIDISCQTYNNSIASLYEQGNYYDILEYTDSLLKTCHFSKDEKINIYKYTAAAAYKDSDDSLFLLYGQKLYTLDPHFKYIEGGDPQPLSYLQYKFKIFPRYTLGMSLGFNNVFVDRVNVFQVMDSADVSEPYSSNMGLTANVLIQYNPSKIISFAYYGGIYFSNFYKKTYFYGGILHTTYAEHIRGISNQAILKLNFPIVNRFNFYPYLMLGGFLDYRLDVSGRINLYVDNNISDYYPNFKMPTISSSTIYYYLNSVNSNRNIINYGYLGGLGFNYFSQSFSLFTDIVFQRGEILNNIPKIRYLNPILRNYYYVDDDIILNKLFVRVGFAYNFKYKVKIK